MRWMFSEAMAAEWQRRLTVITATLLASQSGASLCSLIHLFSFSHRQTEHRNECSGMRKLYFSVFCLLIKGRGRKNTHTHTHTVKKKIQQKKKAWNFFLKLFLLFSLLHYVLSQMSLFCIRIDLPANVMLHYSVLHFVHLVIFNNN